MKKIALALCAGAALASSAAMAAQGDILARFRVINVNPDVKTTGLLASPLSAGVQDDTIPELDFTYMITNNVGAELILGTSRHSVTANRTALGGGNGSIIGRNSFQRPRGEALALLQKLIEIYRGRA